MRGAVASRSAETIDFLYETMRGHTERQVEAMRTQQRMLAVLDASGVLWREITGDDAPEFEITARVVRSA